MVGVWSSSSAPGALQLLWLGGGSSKNTYSPGRKVGPKRNFLRWSRLLSSCGFRKFLSAIYLNSAAFCMSTLLIAIEELIWWSSSGIACCDGVPRVVDRSLLTSLNGGSLIALCNSVLYT